MVSLSVSRGLSFDAQALERLDQLVPAGARQEQRLLLRVARHARGPFKLCARFAYSSWHPWGGLPFSTGGNDDNDNDNDNDNDKYKYNYMFLQIN